MKKISLIGLILTLALLGGTVASAAGSFNADYILETYRYNDTTAFEKGYVLRFNGTFDLNKNCFLDGTFSLGKVTKLFDPDGEEYQLGLGFLKPTYNRKSFGFNYVLAQETNTRFYGGVGYSIYKEHHRVYTTSEITEETFWQYVGITGKAGIDFTVSDKVNVKGNIAWTPSAIQTFKYIVNGSIVYEETNNTRASVIDARIALEYQLTEMVAIEAGYAMNKIAIGNIILTDGGLFFGGSARW